MTWCGCASSWTGSATTPAATGHGDTGDAPAATARSAPAPDTTRAWEALEQAIIGKAVDLLSGPGGLASFLRRRQLGARLGGPSLPLDIGYSETIPASIRNAVILRDQHCQWAGKCSQPAAACQVHHVKHKANGGKTSVKDCVLLCWFHHQVVIHRWGWTLVLNPDGTTTAWNPDKTKVLHSHSPPPGRGDTPAGPAGLDHWGWLVVHGAVVHQAVSCGDHDGLQDAVPAGQGPGGDACLVAARARARMARRVRAPATEPGVRRPGSAGRAAVRRTGRTRRSGAGA